MRVPSHKMGVHIIPVHNRSGDHKYMRDLGPGCIKIINPDPNYVAQCLSYIDRNGIVWLRDHPLSEQHNDAMTKPKETGLRHANEWADKLFRGRFKDVFDPDKIVVSGINEPFVHNIAEETAALEYNLALLNRATELGFRVAALNLSVGWPRNLGKDLPPFWNTFLPLEDAINKGRHFLSVHEYWYNDPDESWFEYNGIPFGWLSYRVNYCPMNVPILIGECGMEKWVDRDRWINEGKPNKGWLGNMSPEVYAEQLWRYSEKVNPNVFSILPFTTDWGSHDWDTQDTKDAHNAIVAKKKNATWSNPYPSKPSKPIEPTEPGEIMLSNWPKGFITQYFGDKRFTNGHTGLDFSMPVGTRLLSMSDGVVQWVDEDVAGYGFYIRVYHPELYIDTFYGHMKELSKLKRGDKIKAGDLLGLSGNTGNSTGPHLHFEVRLHENQATYSPSHYGNGRTDPLFLKHLLENS